MDPKKKKKCIWYFIKKKKMHIGLFPVTLKMRRWASDLSLRQRASEFHTYRFKICTPLSFNICINGSEIHATCDLYHVDSSASRGLHKIHPPYANRHTTRYWLRHELRHCHSHKRSPPPRCFGFPACWLLLLKCILSFLISYLIFWRGGGEKKWQT